MSLLPFQKLPEDLFLDYCLPHLNYVSIDKLACTCKEARKMSLEWKRRYLEDSNINLPPKASVQKTWRGFFYTKLSRDFVEV